MTAAPVTSHRPVAALAALLVLSAIGCGASPAASSTPATSAPVIGNSAEVDGPVRSGAIGALDGEWIDEVGSQFWFEHDGTGAAQLVRAVRSTGDEFTDLQTGLRDGEFWLSYDVPDSDTTVTITLHDWDDDLGGYQCTWDNGERDGHGTLRPRARVDAENGDAEGESDDDDDGW